MSISNHMTHNQARIFERTDTKREIDAFLDLVDDAIRYQGLDAHIGVLVVETRNDGRQCGIQQRVWNGHSNHAGNRGQVIRRNVHYSIDDVGAFLCMLEDFRTNVGEAEATRGALD